MASPPVSDTVAKGRLITVNWIDFYCLIFFSTMCTSFHNMKINKIQFFTQQYLKVYVPSYASYINKGYKHFFFKVTQA